MIANRPAIRSLKHLLTLTITLVAIALAAQPAATQNHLWSQQFGGTSGEFGNSVTVDKKGNIVLTGSFGASVDFGGGFLSSAGFSDAFLAKYDANGVHQWSKRFGDTQSDDGDAVVVDASLNVICAGNFKGTVDFGGGSLISAGETDIFLAKYDEFGVHQWSQRFGDLGFDQPFGVTVDNTDNIYMTGTFQGTVNFGGSDLITVGTQDIFIVKFNANGEHVWSFNFGDNLSDYGRAIRVDDAGNVFLTGAFSGSMSFGGITLVSKGGLDAFLVKFDGDGTHVWSKSFGSASNESGYGLVIDESSDVIVTGNFHDSVDFGGGFLVSAGSDDIFLARYTNGGVHVRSQRFGSTGSDLGTGVDVDVHGNVFLAARFALTVDFGGGSLTSAGSNDIVLAKYDADGGHLWSQRFGGSGSDSPAAPAVDGAGNVIISGSFSSNINFGGGTFSSAGNQDTFLAKFDAPLTLPNISSVLDVGNDQGGSVRVTFQATNKDFPGSAAPVLQYGAYRRIDTLPSVALRGRSYSDASEPHIGPATDIALDERYRESFMEGWEFVGSIPASGEPVYSMIVPTLADSTIASGEHWSSFFIRGFTADPYTFFDSPPDSGYSLDNLSPSVPQNPLFIASRVLAWDQVPDADLDYYTVYGSWSPVFDGTAIVIEFTTGNTSNVGWNSYPHYFVTATDFSGNESGPAIPTPLTGISDTPLPQTPMLSSHPNPFNPTTTITFTVASAGPVTLAVYDVDGGLIETLLDREYRTPDTYQLQFRPTSASGVYFARLTAGGRTRSIKLVLLK
jgi:hypothetical protein